MSATHSSSADQSYGVARVCRAWEIARSTYYDWRKRSEGGQPQGRRGPKPIVPDDELVERIRAIHGRLERERGIRSEGYRKTHARLRHEGVRTAKHRVLRLMREHALLSPTRVGRPRGPRVHDGRILTAEPDVMWGTDATTTTTLDGGPPGSSLPSITAPARSWGSTRRGPDRDSKHSNPSTRESESDSGVSRPASLPDSPCATTTARSTPRAPSRTS